ncbi:MAG: hypothetical protein LBP19_06570 [Treponema sp.]|jgi:hypothetical protein|nr:hypothetical protein [Treponema sp.]
MKDIKNQKSAAMRHRLRTWLKTIYMRLSPLYRRQCAVEHQINTAVQQVLDRIGVIETTLKENENRRQDIANAALQQALDRIGSVETTLKENESKWQDIANVALQQTLDRIGSVETTLKEQLKEHESRWRDQANAALQQMLNRLGAADLRLKTMNQTINMVSVKTSTLNLHATRGGGGVNRRTITVFFLVHNIEVWSSLDGVYRAMLKDGLFSVIVASCHRKYPSGTSYHDEDVVHEGLQKAGVHHIRFVSEDGYEELTILKRLRPDVIFRQSPWDNDIPPAFSRENLMFARLYYVPYEIMLLLIDTDKNKNENEKFMTNYHHSVEHTFVLNETVKQEYEDRYAAASVAVTDHPRVDEILRAKPEWPLYTNNAFRVLWSPHHSIFDGWYDFGTFLTTCEPILAMAADTADADFLLAMHPGLLGSFERLEKDNPKEYARVQHFFAEWERLPNTGTLRHGGYMTAMKASDLLITDGISLLAEYQFVTKPILFIEREGHTEFNSIGKRMSAGWNTVASTDMDTLKEMVLYFKNGGTDSHRDAQIKNVEFLTQHLNAAENILHIIKQDFGF